MEKRKWKALREEYKCPICEFKTDNPHGIGGHIKGHKDKGEIKSPPKKENICDICQKPFPTPHGVIVHKALVHQKYGKYYKKYGHLPGKAQEEVKTHRIEFGLKEGEVLDPSEVADELLTKVVETINRTSDYQNQIAARDKEILELEGELKKERDEKERILRAYNDNIKRGGRRLPPIDDILSARGRR